MKFRLEITCENAAFEDDPGGEIQRILEDLAYRIEAGTPWITAGGFGESLFDHNGNAVGFWQWED